MDEYEILGCVRDDGTTQHAVLLHGELYPLVAKEGTWFHDLDPQAQAHVVDGFHGRVTQAYVSACWRQGVVPRLVVEGSGITLRIRPPAPLV